MARTLDDLRVSIGSRYGRAFGLAAIERIAAFVDAFDAWVATNPESLRFPGPGDEEAMVAMLAAREKLDLWG